MFDVWHPLDTAWENEMIELQIACDNHPGHFQPLKKDGMARELTKYYFKETSG